MIKACDRWIIKNAWLARILCFLAFAIPTTLALAVTDAPAGVFVILYLLFALASFGRVMHARANIAGKAIDKLDNECDPYPFKEACDFLLTYTKSGIDREIIKIDIALFYSMIGDVEENLRILQSVNLEANSTLPAVKAVYYNNLSSGYIDKGDLTCAELWYQNACKAIEGVKNKKQRAHVEISLASTAAELEYLRGNYEKSLEMYQKIENDTVSGKVFNSFVCAKAHLALGNKATAEILLNYVVEAGNKLAVVEEAKKLLAENNI